MPCWIEKWQKTAGLSFGHVRVQHSKQPTTLFLFSTSSVCMMKSKLHYVQCRLYFRTKNCAPCRLLGQAWFVSAPYIPALRDGRHGPSYLIHIDWLLAWLVLFQMGIGSLATLMALWATIGKYCCDFWIAVQSEFPGLCNCSAVSHRVLLVIEVYKDRTDRLGNQTFQQSSRRVTHNPHMDLEDYLFYQLIMGDCKRSQLFHGVRG